MIDLLTGSRRDDVTASVGELSVSKSGRFVVIVNYERQHAVAVHCVDGLLRQVAEEDVVAGITRRCRAKQVPSSSTALESQPEPEITIDEFDRRCRLPPPPPVCSYTAVIQHRLIDVSS